LTRYGLAVVTVDARGTGASYGSQQYPFSEEEVEDGGDIVDWITTQSWSNGNVVTCGNSYAGATAELTLTLNHPAVKCAVIKQNPWDFYQHSLCPGGCFNSGFIGYWSKLGKALDQTHGKALLVFKPINPLFAIIAYLVVKGVKLILSGKSDNILKTVARIHAENKYPVDYAEIVKFRDDVINEKGITIDHISTFNYKEKIEKLNVPLYCRGSWQDSTTADMIISRFLNFKNPQKAIIGDWDHGALHRANPYYPSKAPASLSLKDKIKDWVRFYNDCLNNKFNLKRELYYYTMGEEKWKKTSTWPPLNQIKEKWYLSNNNKLSLSSPRDESGQDKYEVNFQATTGIRNRWYTLLSLPIKYPNRKKEDKKLLTYTSDPLKEDLEITGHPIFTIFISSTHEDGMICAYLEFINKKGNIFWITDGQIRLVHRKISSKIPPYKLVVPYHSFKKEDYSPMIPGKIAEITFALYPTSILMRRGSRIRLSLSAADKDTFARYPESGNPTITVERNKIYSSFIELPIIKKNENLKP
jgi:hypothetical protein